MKSTTTISRRRTTGTPIAKTCHFCSEGIAHIDYKDIRTLRRYVSRYMKIEGRKRTGTCARHQRALGTALKRSRILALIPFVLN
jgi:small subunit ribosomal protein S18